MGTKYSDLKSKSIAELLSQTSIPPYFHIQGNQSDNVICIHSINTGNKSDADIINLFENMVNLEDNKFIIATHDGRCQNTECVQEINRLFNESVNQYRSGELSMEDAIRKSFSNRFKLAQKNSCPFLNRHLLQIH